jgi:hypothetical protein
MKEYQKEYDKKRQQTPERKAYLKEYRQTPEYKEQRKQYDNKYRAKIRTDTQGEGTLEAFLSVYL